jgi:hypothetical protein
MSTGFEEYIADHGNEGRVQDYIHPCAARKEFIIVSRLIGEQNNYMVMTTTEKPVKVYPRSKR